MANGREQQWRRSPRYHGCTGFGIILGNVADEADTKRLAGLEWCEVRLEFKCIATSWLDVGRCRRAADVPGRAAFRRMRARNGRACDAPCRSQDASRIYLSCRALCLIHSGEFDKLSRDGATIALEGE